MDQFSRAGEPTTAKRAEDEQQIVLQAVGDIVDVGPTEISKRIRLGTEEVLGPEPVLVVVIIGPTHSIDFESEPAVVEGLHLRGERRMQCNEAGLKFQLLQARNIDQFTLQEESVGDAHCGPAVPPGSLGVGGEIRQNGDGLTGTVIDNGYRGDDWATVDINGCQAGR